jgi:Tfp pilus assembly protein PilX
VNTRSFHAARASGRRMHGIALPVVLMFLLIITISAV